MEKVSLKLKDFIKVMIMNKHNLFICETPFQVLAALLIIYNWNDKSDINDFILTDNMNKADNLMNNMSDKTSVNYVYYAQVNHSQNSNLINNMLDEIIPFNKRWSYKYTNTFYDRLYLRNFSETIAVSSYNYFNKKNPELEVFIYDEGYSNYTNDFWHSEQHLSKAHKIVNFMMRLMGRKNIYSNITSAMLFLPNMLHLDLPFPLKDMIHSDFELSREQVSEINSIFNYDNFLLKDLEQKYIFFEECFSNDSNNNKDLVILNSIAEIVGKDKIIIKLHPRSCKDRFTPLGYCVMKKITCPWEVVAINNARVEKLTLLAVSSGALLNYLLFTKCKIRSILLYEIFNDSYEHVQKQDIFIWFDEFCNQFKDNIIVPTSMRQLKEIFDKTNNNEKD